MNFLIIVIGICLFGSPFLSSYPIENDNCLIPYETVHHFSYFYTSIDYSLRNLVNSTKYEIHISYQHTDPTIFSLTLVPYPISYHPSSLAIPPGYHHHPSSSLEAHSSSTTGRRLNANDDSTTTDNTILLSSTDLSVIQYGIREDDLILHDKDTDMEKLIFTTDINNLIRVPYRIKNLSTGYFLLPTSQVKVRLYTRPRGYSIQPSETYLPRQGTWYNLRLDPYYLNIIPSHSIALLYIIPLALVCSSGLVYFLLYSTLSPFYGYTLFASVPVIISPNEQDNAAPLLSPSIAKKNNYVSRRTSSRTSTRRR